MTGCGRTTEPQIPQIPQIVCFWRADCELDAFVRHIQPVPHAEAAQEPAWKAHGRRGNNTAHAPPMDAAIRC